MLLLTHLNAYKTQREDVQIWNNIICNLGRLGNNNIISPYVSIYSSIIILYYKLFWVTREEKKFLLRLEILSENYSIIYFEDMYTCISFNFLIAILEKLYLSY